MEENNICFAAFVSLRCIGNGVASEADRSGPKNPTWSCGLVKFLWDTGETMARSLQVIGEGGRADTCSSGRVARSFWWWAVDSSPSGGVSSVDSWEDKGFGGAAHAWHWSGFLDATILLDWGAGYHGSCGGRLGPGCVATEVVLSCVQVDAQECKWSFEGYVASFGQLASCVQDVTTGSVPVLREQKTFGD